MTSITRRLCLGMLGACAWMHSLMAIDTGDFIRERMLGDLDHIKNTFLSNYAQAEWKMKYAGWDLEVEINAAKDKVRAAGALTTKDFQVIVKEFFFTVKDYHATVQFHSTAAATLPFLIQSAGDRYFFSYIDQSQLPKDNPFPFAIGDELLLIDGVAVDQVVKDFTKMEVGSNQPATDQGLAEIYLTTRLGALGHIVPEGTLTLGGRKMGTTEVTSYTVAWDCVPEKINNLTTAFAKKMGIASHKAAKKGKKKCGQHHFFQKRLIMPHYAALAASREDDVDPMDMLGSKKSFIPVLGNILWQNPSSSIFHAYLFELADGTPAGYVRIATYELENTEKAVLEFADIIDLFESEAEVLVVDQVNNPGGLILYMYALASMLTDQPLTIPQHRQMLTQEDVYFALMEMDFFAAVESDEDAKDLLGETLEGIPVTLEVVQSLLGHFRFMVDEWNNGQMFTKAGYLYGIGPLPPHPEVHYTKPILLLVNALDFSGGDFFPAIMQDNGRATIMGTRTAGAGGYVSKAMFPNLSGISDFCYTASIAERQDHRLIENAGVTPDIHYEASVADLQNNYVEYGKKILQTLDTLVKGDR